MLSDVAGEIYKCLRCGWCREKVMEETRRVCPAREVLGFESTFGRGRVLMARGILEGELNYSEELMARMFTCLGCGACRSHCPLEVDTIKIFRAMREDAVEKGVPLPKVLADINWAVEKNKNPLGKVPEARKEQAKSLAIARQGGFFYFAGCYDTLRYPSNFTSAVQIFRKAGVEPAYLGEDEWCCGVPQIWNGSTDLARKLAVHNIESLAGAGAKMVIMSCAGCYNAFGHFYKELYGDLPFEVMHITQFIAGRLQDGVLNIDVMQNKHPGAVTYHDPCHLGRHMGVYEEPRLLIREMFPQSFREMPRNRENAWCCGGGAVVFPYLPQYSMRISDQRTEEALEVGAGTIITACPSCVNVLKTTARKKKIEVANLLDFLAGAVR